MVYIIFTHLRDRTFICITKHHLEGGDAMIDVYPSVEENGIEGAERIARMYRREGVDVTIEHTQIPQWGSAIPTSSTYGKTELGYRVIVDDHRPAGSYGLQRNG